MSTPPDVLPGSALLAGVSAAAQAAAASLVAVLVPAVAAWLTGAGSEATWSDVVRLSLALWLLAQHGGLVIEGGHIGLVPLGLTAVPVASCWFAGRRLARSLDPRAAAIESGSSRARPARPPSRALAAFIGAYAALAALAALVASSPAARVVTTQVVLGALVIALVAAPLGAAAWTRGSALGGVIAIVAALNLPAAVQRWLRPGAVALGAILAASAVLLAGALVAGRSGVRAVHESLDPGVVGGAVLTVAQLALLPVAVVWVAAMLTGTGFGIGTDTSVTLWNTSVGSLPAVPILGAVPPPGDRPGWAVGLIAIPVLAGVLAGAVLTRGPDRPTSWRVLLADAGGTGLVAGGGLMVLAWLASGPIGPGRMQAAGPHPWLVSAACTAQVAIGAVLAVLAITLARRLRR